MIKKLLLLISLIAIPVGVMEFFKTVEPPQPKNFDKEFYYQLVEEPLNLNGNSLLMGIVPHHLVAKPWISEFWATIGNSKPKRIFLLSPNHFDSNTHKITTTSVALHLFKDVEFVKANDTVISNDHGITTHLPFVEYFTKSSQLVPLVVSNTTTKEELEIVAHHLIKEVNPSNDVIVASIDFSHYLNKNVADQKDQETLNYLNEMNTNAIIRLTNDHVDARSGLVLFLRAAQLLNCQKPTIFHHGNSADFVPKTSTSSTSYFVAGITASQCKD